MSNGLKLAAICMVYYYGLRVRHVKFDPTKVDTQAKYFLAVNFWDNEVMLPRPLQTLAPFVDSTHLE